MLMKSRLPIFVLCLGLFAGLWFELIKVYADPAATPGPQPIKKTGLHNVHRITDWLISGSSPEGAEGFRSLQELGVKTVISVDGARPDVSAAKQYGMRYVHIPIGYDGITRDTILKLAKAAQEFPRPVYLHCHHGKHRGPAAAAAIHLCLDERCTVGQALAELKTFGTDPRYKGLYETISQLERPTQAQLKATPADFPETANVGSFVERMVEVDATWDHLKAIRAAGWKVPADNPDLDPAQEALQLLEHYREASRLPEQAQRPAAFRELLKVAETEATRLEAEIRGQGNRPLNPATLEPLFKRSEAACAQCHMQFRDIKPR